MNGREKHLPRRISIPMKTVSSSLMNRPTKLFGKKKKARRESDCLRIAPEQRIAGKFDAASIAKFPVAEPGKMGFRVLDDCAEEHQM